MTATPPSPSCANPSCPNVLPAGATARRRYCSPACRQAHHRHRHGGRAAGRPAPATAHLAALDRLLAAVAGELARLATLAAEEVESASAGTARCHYADRITGLAADLVDAAVARDRAAGMAWDEIGEWLGLHPDTARVRHRQAAQDLAAGAHRAPGRRR
jgi:hypothetical protein